MKITNKYGLPEALVRAITNDPYTYTGNISVTQLIQPPQLRWLTHRYWEELEEDATDRIWSLLGSAVHTILERAEDKHAADLQEVRLEAETDGWVWSGQADIYEHPGKLYDYKVTSSWTAISEPKDDWVSQLNMLAYLYRNAGFAVDKLGIVAIYRDFSKFKAMQSKNYPKHNSEVVNIPMWSDEEVVEYVSERIALHKGSEHLPDDQLPECTDKECWKKPTSYAIMKNKNKRATRVFETNDEAEVMLGKLVDENPKDKYYIDIRVGEYTRCEHYCPVKKYCHQYKRRNEKNAVEE